MTRMRAPAAVAVAGLSLQWVWAQVQPSADATVSNYRSAQTPLYTVKDGNKVDAKTLMGWKTWRALACERCHGASQEGLVGPPLVDSLKVLSKDQFHTTIMNGRLEKGMPNFNASKMVTDNWENLYAYLKGRADGNIDPGHLYPLEGGGDTGTSNNSASSGATAQR